MPADTEPPLKLTSQWDRASNDPVVSGHPPRLDTLAGKELLEPDPVGCMNPTGSFPFGSMQHFPECRGGPGAEPLGRSLAPEAPLPPELTVDELSRLEAELDHTPAKTRYDEPFQPEPVKLETRGVTSQLTFWEAQTIHKESVCAKLNSLGRYDLSEPLARCHSYQTAAVCTTCGKSKLFFNRCEHWACPQCQPRLSKERKKSVQWWTLQIRQPKHVVLTARNTEGITKDHVKWFKAQFARLRRRKFARNWTGGFYSLEVTNEGRGWHLHCHVLVDAKWVDQQQLSIEWGKLVGQEYAIVKVKDCRCSAYLKEVTKYTVKGSQLASWAPTDIAAFLDAFQGVRTFGVFGTLYGKRTEWKEYIDSLQSEPPECDCGGKFFRIMTPEEAEIFEPYQPAAARPPPEPKAEPDWLLPL